MRRLLAVIVVASVSIAVGSSGGVEAAANGTYISGGALPYAIRLAAADEDAFMRRLNPPPRLEEPPEVSGASYTVRSPYWTAIMPGVPGTRDAAGEEAAFYPEGGYVSAPRSDGTTTWLVLDVRQQAILGRYIRLGTQAVISPFPGVLQVLKADVQAGGQFGLQLGSRDLTVAEASAFWQRLPLESRALTGVDAASPVPLRDEVARPHELPPAAAWLVITTPEGRSIDLLYRSDMGLIYDLTAQQVYQAPASIFGPVLASGDSATAPALVPQQEGAGSPLWWLLAIAAAGALLGAAAWLRRSLRAAS
jgi:hypothetical protein